MRNWFGGVYQDPKNFIAQFAVEPESWHAMYKEFKVPPEQWKAFLEDRQGAVVGAATAKRFGWKLGDRVPITGTIFPGRWEFNIRAIYTGTRPSDDETQFWFQYKGLDERRQYGKGTIGWYVVRVSDPDKAVDVVKAIDDRFANSSYETRTFTESAFAANFAKQMGNIKFLLILIGSVVFATLLLVTGSTMAIAVRERTAELGILKAIGYSDRSVLGLVVAESLIYAVVGGGLVFSPPRSSPWAAIPRASWVSSTSPRRAWPGASCCCSPWGSWPPPSPPGAPCACAWWTL
jgi:putative ABC transport system permease protein